VFGGTASDASGHEEFAIARLTAAGQPDTSFGTGGAAYAQPSQASTPQSLALAVVATPDGGYAVAGFAAASSTEAAAVARFTGTGQLDTAFGSGGTTVLSVPSLLDSLADEVIAQNDGKLIVIGSGIAGVAGPMVALLNADGTLDTGFGLGGTAVSGLSQPYEGFALSGALTSAGNLVLAGVGEPESSGGTGSFLQELSIDTAPTASLDYAPTRATVGVPVQFFSFATAAAAESITHTSWDFGSGSFGTVSGSSPSYTFTEPGTYTVRVQETDGFGLSSIASQAITVLGPSMKVVSIKADSKGVHIKLSCQTAACDVDASLATVEHLKGRKITRLSASGKGKQTRTVKVGSAKLRLAAGMTETVTLKLNGTGKNLLRRFKSIPAKASFVITDSHNNTLERTFKIR
jgi:uncharacterized delta-60 repeat protein